MLEKRSYMAMDLVRHEIQETLLQAIKDLDLFLLDRDDLTKVRFALAYMHQVVGSLVIIESHAASVLAKEIEDTIQKILIESVEVKQVYPVVALVKKTIQGLSDYIDRLLDHGHDDISDLLPGLNALRAINDSREDPFTEADLFNPNIPNTPSTHAKEHLEIKNFNQIIRNLRTHFQRALINLLKHTESPQNLMVIVKVTKALSQSAIKTQSEPFWKIAYQLVNYLHRQNKPLDEFDKKAIVSIEQQVKNLEDLGAKGFLNRVNEQHFKYVLYAIAIQADSSSELESVIVDYNLDKALAKQKHDLIQIKPQSGRFQVSLNLAKNKIIEIKSVFINLSDSGWDNADIDSVPTWLKSLSEELDERYFLSLPHLSQQLATVIEKCIQLDAHPDLTKVIEPIADVIAAMDYFIECLEKEDKQNLASILIAAEHKLPTINDMIPKPIVDSGLVLKGDQVKSTDKDETIESSVFVLPDGVDIDIIDIFIEEAKEVTAELRNSLIILEKNPDDTDTLATVKRGWHTLKGSSRMVGLVEVGDFAYHFEQCFTRFSSGLEQLNVATLQFVLKALDHMDTIVSALDNEVYFDFTCLQRFLGSNQQNVDCDPELLTIFVQEAETHLNVLTQFLQINNQFDSAIKATNELQRALHTLKGSAYMAEITSISSIASPLELFVKSLYNFDVNIDETIRNLLCDAESILRSTLAQLAQNQIVDQVKIDALIVAIIDSQATYFQTSQPEDNFYDHLLTGAMQALSDLAKLVETASERTLTEVEHQAILAALSNLFVLAHKEQTKDIQYLVALVYKLFGSWSPAVAFNQIQHLVTEIFSLLDDLFDQFAAHQPVYLNDEKKLAIAEKLNQQLQRLTSPNDMISLSDTENQYLTSILPEINSGLNLIEQRLKEWQFKLDQATFSLLKQTIHEVKDQFDHPSCIALSPYLSEMLKTLNKLSLHDSFEPTAVLSVWQLFLDIESTLQCMLAGNNVLPEHQLEKDTPLSDIKSTAEVSHNIIVIDWKLSAAQCKQADPDTLAFFIEEAKEIIISLDELVHKKYENNQLVTPCQEIKRLLHTLKGGARLTELIVLGDLTHQFETIIEHAEHQNTLPTFFNQELVAYFILLQKGLDIVFSGGEIQHDIDNDAIEANTTDVNVHLAMEAIDTSQLDTDTVLLFVEEATDQLEQMDIAIAGFIQDQHRGHISELKRLLHTLKGGARLAEIESIANLSHHFETILIQSEGGGLSDLNKLTDQIQPLYDQLQQQLASLKIALDEQSNDTIAHHHEFFQDLTNSAATQATQQFFEKLNEGQSSQSKEPVKVAAPLIDKLVNLAGETSINRSRLDEQHSDLVFSMEDMSSTIDRLHNQLRRLEIETEAQILFRQEQVVSEGQDNFDPLEMDRYTHMQQLSKSLVESASDLDDISATFNDKLRDLETLLLQQSRLNSELQEGLMSAQMVPFSRMVPRLRRIVRQTADVLGKQVEFVVLNPEGELDRTILEKVISPLEHMLRNAVDHGIELPAQRLEKNKEQQGRITLSVIREGGEVILTLKDDGAGINIEAVRAKAKDRGLITDSNSLSDKEVIQFILHSGFSTAQKVTQISGRGVGMDVVYNEIKQIGGTVEIDSSSLGTVFIVRLPFTVAVNRVLMVNMGKDSYAIPLNSIEGIIRVDSATLNQLDGQVHFDYGGQIYQLVYLGTLLNTKVKAVDYNVHRMIPVILIRGQDQLYAIEIDAIIGSQEIVVKSLGPQFAMVNGLGGATVLGDGRVVVILDMQSLIRADFNQFSRELISAEDTRYDRDQESLSVMVVDDSVTVRKVTSRLLERHKMQVTLAKDGLDAMNQLQAMEILPDVILLDIEMPRMDGFEVVSRVKHSDHLKQIAICMITSRTGQKHRDRAISLGADAYLGKPFQERELLETISTLITDEAIG